MQAMAPILRLWAVCLLTSVAWGVDIFPLREVRAGQRGVGRTVFSGTKVEEFQVDVLGVMENIAPQQTIILARLSGGPLAQTGVIQGMSGSPVYIDGRLMGAVAMGFELAKEPVAGIRPIEEMLRVAPGGSGTAQRAAITPRLTDIATPVSFAGFSAATLEQFGPRLRELGLDPRQGVSGGGRPPDAMGDPARLEAGSMISVQMLSGDMTVGADGTVTLVEDGKVYAFGHRLLAGGATEMPFASSEVLTVLPALNNSFKISRALEWMGTITQDRSTAISGVTGQRARMTPIEITVGGTGGRTYRMNVIQDAVMTPLVTQMAVASALETTGRAVGPTTLHVRGELRFASGTVKLDNVYSGDVSVGAVAASGIAAPLNYALASGFDALKLTGMSLDISTVEERRQMQIASVAGPRYARPGEQIELAVHLTGPDGAEAVRKVQYRVPVGAREQAYNFTVSDAAQANAAEFQALAGVALRSAEQVLDRLNGQRANTNAYLRVVRAGESYQVEGRELPSPPPSVAMILGRSQPGSENTVALRGAQVAEVEIPVGESMVTGSKTIQIEVRP